MYLKVRPIDILKYKLGEFVFMIIYILSVDKKDHKVYAFISCKLHPIDGLIINILVSNNVLYIKGFAINLSTSSTFIYNCGMRFVVSAKKYSDFWR